MHISIHKLPNGEWECTNCGKTGTYAVIFAEVCEEFKSCVSPDEQLKKWVAGESVCPNNQGECCPDFSCCTPDALAPVEARQAFLAASPQDRENLLMSFLGGLTAGLKENVHIAGKDQEN